MKRCSELITRLVLHFFGILIVVPAPAKEASRLRQLIDGFSENSIISCCIGAIKVTPLSKKLHLSMQSE